uniref:Amino acid transporter n=1 Tax=Neogobius melanostomus TaxID=47308 RepID=A0A8C6TSV9_9GOBI
WSLSVILVRGPCRNGLLTLSVISVITGCTLGFTLRGTQLSTQIYFSFPGELLMRMLKMLILPLITSSLMSGLSSMESKACCRMGVLTVTYYLWTTFIAVVVGIVLVLIVKPGVGTEMESNRLGGGPVMTSADALLDLIRNMVPSNLVEATFRSPPETSPCVYGRTVYLELTPPPEVHYRTGPGTSQQMNVLGIVIFSAVMGQPVAGQNGERGAPLVNVCQCINDGASMKIIKRAVYFPFGIIFLVAGKILDMADPSTLGKKLGWYGLTVLTGLFVHGLILLPLFYFILTRQKPLQVHPRAAAGPWSSRSPPRPGQTATNYEALYQHQLRGCKLTQRRSDLRENSPSTCGNSCDTTRPRCPITMKCLLENCNVDRQIARFVLPVGATINMDGTALYEAVAAIFIAQVNDYELDFGQIVTISITATAASVGAAGIPQAGLVTMVIVLTSVGLPPDDITLIVAIDWILDRFRTMINVLGDALAAGIIAHLCRKDFPLSKSGKVTLHKHDTAHVT